ncbi:glycosyl hydrolase [Streptomyces sp. NPDC051940]|uniref:glycosyl hydrolase n=1 Tax=Streptomyces sp. NPDC051940 TaxID=3155675 RepID=UPI00341B62EB
MTLPPALDALLKDPPRGFSPTAIWWWSGEPLRRDRLRWQLARFAEGGVYNLVVLNLAPSGPMFDADADDPPFFSDAWWALLKGVCDDAGSLGVRLWFYDQLGFSGAAVQSGLVHERPEFAGRWLERDGSVSVRGFDYLSRESCAALLDRVHGEFERRLGDRLGGVVAGSFQDELPTLPTWSAGFAAEFRERRGYEPEPLLRLLWQDGPTAGRFRRDYQRTRSELAEESFFRPLADWHDRHGLLSGCDQQDPARAGDPAAGVELYADYARTHRWFSAPGSDHHGDARVHSSLAHLYGRPRTWIEAFHSSGWGGTLEETYDWLLPWLRAGANLYNPHAVYYTTKGGWWEWAPPATDWRQPYWRHHHVFAGAVSRLSAALTLGRHVCDVAVLLPTATVQAGVRLDGVRDAAARRAQTVYRELVGDMTWFRSTPGALDRLGLDADVIDDDSVRRAAVRDGRLTVADESYAAVVLPACTVLEGATERRLAEFAAAGGLVVAVGERPPPGPLRERARFAPTADALGPLLTGLRRVEAPVPPLVREADGTTLVFLAAAFPGASRVSVGRPDDRGAAAGWAEATVDFDPARYARETAVRVRGVAGDPYLVDPFTGNTRVLPGRRSGDGVEVTVPFDAGPAALLVFPAEPAGLPAGAPDALPADTIGLGAWTYELIPTLDDTWGDFALDESWPGLAPGAASRLQRWAVEHRADGDEDWRTVHATFGPHGEWRTGDGPWQPAVYSVSRGIRKDPVHRAALGPKGHVPREFLDFGTVAAGRQVHFRAELTVPAEGCLSVGAAAAKRVRVDGRDVELDDHGYLAFSRLPLGPGTALLELELTVEGTDPQPLRAQISVTTDPEAARGPEWIVAAPGPAEFIVRFQPLGEVLQVSAEAACRVLVNGTEVGRQGGFDPYTDHRRPRTDRYDLSAVLVPGENVLAVRTADAATGLLVDGAATSGPGWSATRDGEALTVRTRRTQFRDPGSLQLPRRPHPLPGAAWLEGPQDGTVLPALLAVPGSAGRVEWLRFGVPPGATALRLPVSGTASVYVDGQLAAAGPGPLAVPLEGGRGVRRALVRVEPERACSGGAVLTGPVQFAVGPGPLRLGDWADAGLPEYSGGVRYRTAVESAGTPKGALLDLGRVRGTAEVFVNGRSCGIQVCSPYRFEVGEALRPGRNEVAVEVFGTLAPFLDAVSPTHFVFPGQTRSGLFGPVRLRVTR